MQQIKITITVEEPREYSSPTTLSERALVISKDLTDHPGVRTAVSEAIASMLNDGPSKVAPDELAVADGEGSI